MRKTIATVVAAGLLTVGGAGTAFAQGDGDPNAGDPNAPTETGAPEDRAGRRHPRLRALRLAVTTAAETIGVEREELVDAVRGGQTIAAFAQSKGVEPQQVKDAVLAALNQRIDQAVAEGKVPEDRAAQVKERLPERVDKVLSSLPERASGTGQEPTPST